MNPNSQVSGFAQSSPSLFSEPPNIKNWFSSYTYQSPALDSNEDFCISPTRVDEGVYEDEGLCVEDSEGEEEAKCVNLTKIGEVHQSGSGGVSNGYHSLVRKSVEEAMQEHCVPDAEIPTYPDSFYLPSEPPDITNWFSSYAYESPELDSADFDISPPLNDNIGNHENAVNENDVTSKEFTMKLKGGLLSHRELISDGCNMTVTSTGVENKRSSAVQKRDSEESSFFSQNNMCPEMTSEQSTQRAGIGVCSITSVPCPRIRDETLGSMMNPGPQTIEAEGHLNLMFSAKASYREAFSETCQDKTANKSEVTENSSGWVKLKRKSEETFCKRSKQDENQYTSTKNTPLVKRSISRTNNENSQKPRPRKCKTNSTVTREVFKDTTNTQYPSAQESAGQWRCPQKNKPNPGPSLKQLRLERWVHRI